MTHDELADRLARHLRGRQDPPMVWADMQLGPAGSPRPDVYAIDKSYSAFRPMVYEVKVSVSDFRADVTKGKWQTYRPMASGIWFVFPDTLKIGRDDVPAECGILRYNEAADKWSTLRRPVLRAIDSLPQKVWLKLLIDGVGRERGPEWRRRQFNEWRAAEQARKKFGDRVADVLRDLPAAEARLQAVLDGTASELVLERERLKAATENQRRLVEQQVARERARITEREHDLARALGLSHGYQLADIARRLELLARAANGGNSYGELDNALHRVDHMREQLAKTKEAMDALLGIDWSDAAPAAESAPVRLAA